MATKVVRLPYEPRPIQKFLHDNLARFTVAVCHRRFGKTVWCINQLIIDALKNPRKRPQYAYIAPEKSQAKKIAWEYIKEFTAPIPGVRVYEAELKIEIPLNKTSAFIYLEGAENPDRLRGMYFDGVILDEVAQMPRSIWTEVTRPALSDRNGWAIFIGTPKGKNYFKQLYERGLGGDPEWKSFMFKASETKVLSEAELESVKKDLDHETFEQEYECSFDAALPGSYYGKQIAAARADGRIGEFNWNPKLPVITAWDIGINDKTVIWFAQQKDNQMYLIDYYENSGESLVHYINHVKGKAYSYDYHIVPHDVKQRNFSSGSTRLDEMQSLGLKCKVTPRIAVQDGINAAKSLLPVCHFNKTRCEEGLNALSYYHSQYNDKNDVQQLVPVHDWSSHAADAFRYLATGSKPDNKMYPSGRDGTNLPKHFISYEDYDPLN